MAERERLVNPVRSGTADSGSQDVGMFPFDAFEFDPPSASNPVVKLKTPWRWNPGTWIVRQKVVSSDNYTILDNDGYTDILVSTGASNRTITLPLLANNVGRVLRIVKTDSGAGTVIVDGNGSETVGVEAAAVSLSLLKQGDFVTLEDWTTSWAIIASKKKYFVISTTMYEEGTWYAYTPTFTGFGTCTGIVFYWRRNGGSVEVWGSATSGTPTATQALISLPLSLTTESYIPGGAVYNSIMGNGQQAGAAIPIWIPLCQGGQGTISWGYSGAAGLSPVNGNALVGATTHFTVAFSVAVSGWN